MQSVLGTLHYFLQKMQLFLCFLNRNLAELLKVLHESESGLACACAGSLVSLNELSLGVYLEIGDFSIDFFNKLFHFFVF